MLFEDKKLVDALRDATDGWSGDAAAVDSDVAASAADLLVKIEKEATEALEEGNSLLALMTIKDWVRDAMAPRFPE